MIIDQYVLQPCQTEFFSFKIRETLETITINAAFFFKHLVVLDHRRGEFANGALGVVEHGDLTGADVLERDGPVPEPIDLVDGLVPRRRPEDPPPDAPGVAAESQKGAAAPAEAELRLEPGLGAHHPDVAGPLDGRRGEQPDEQVGAVDLVALAVSGQAQLPASPHRRLDAGAVELWDGALAPDEPHVTGGVCGVERGDGRTVGDLLEEDVEAAAAAGARRRRNVVGLAEDGVVGREPEDRGAGGGDGPGHHRREALQAVLAAGAAAEQVLADAVQALAVHLELRLGQVERRRQLENFQNISLEELTGEAAAVR
jgi:hypothetical protein